MHLSAAVVASLLAAASASPLRRRQGGGSGLPKNTTEVSGSASNETYTTVADTFNGTSLNTPVFTSEPQYYNQTFNSTNEPFPGAHNIYTPATKNGTNTTMAWPFQPAGGLMIREPTYNVKSNFDFQSLNLALNQELIELDLFHNGLAKFSTADFEAAGLTADDRFLIEHMADQEVGHALALGNILGQDRSAKMCTYQYPYNDVKEFITFCQLLTRFGEAGVYGFLGQLDSRPAAQILLQSITTEARQQMAFRQLQGLAAQPEWFETGLPQSYAWTMLSPFIKSCPETNPRVEWQNFPALNITNQPYVFGGTPGINSNYSLTSGAGRVVEFTWEEPGKVVGYDNLYKTSTVAGKPTHLAIINQLNVTYAPLMNVSNNSASAIIPEAYVLANEPQLVNTVFMSLVDNNVSLTPYNISMINNHTVAGPTWFFAS
ncbi:ferritin-like domain-containing protein [Sporobolomyces koalae]|uniref:ferritin-like domain-containing protein n=1 Tax=Sporobolomyces koalae TaxID=500713 RepID=UPI00316BBA63